MDETQNEIAALLGNIAQQLRAIQFDEFAEQFNKLAQEVYQPCVIAIVGQVKAGKSSFINALLEADLATVGTTETTATINYFYYSRSAAEQSIRCVRRDGRVERVDAAFLHSLQGATDEILSRAEDIDHFEYYLCNHYLEHIALVDTPGTGAVVSEHQNRTASFLQLERQLRDRHASETQTIGDRADAIIYVMKPTASVTDQDFLEDFRHVTRGSAKALNVIGVMAKIDVHPDIMARRKELAAKIGEQLAGGLNTVVPVSAGLQRAMTHLLANDAAKLRRLMAAMRRVPPEQVKRLLKGPEIYLRFDTAKCLITIEERKAVLADVPGMPWTVFTTIAHAAADPYKDVASITQEMSECAGFAQLNSILTLHFFNRRQFLHCYRMLIEAQNMIDTIRFEYVCGRTPLSGGRT